MLKTLLFEGAGWDKADSCGDVGNCRIRTRLTNNKGKVIYLEMSTGVKDRGGFVWHCFENHCNEKSDFRELESQNFIWSKKHILDFVNYYLDCSFDVLEVDNTGALDVHASKKALC
jgi:hypothetical protein